MDTLDIVMERGTWIPSLSHHLPGYLWRMQIIRDGRRYSGADDDPWTALAMALEAMRTNNCPIGGGLSIVPVVGFKRKKQRPKISSAAPEPVNVKPSRQQELRYENETPRRRDPGTALHARRGIEGE